MTTFTTQDRQDAERDDVAKKALENFKPQWQDVQRTPLTDDQCIDMLVAVCKPGAEGGVKQYLTAPEMAIKFARAIERAHGIGE
jgi:hypothetical protein